MDIAVESLAADLEEMIKGCDDKFKSVLWAFFTQYKDELIRHFEYEEKVVFPYIISVLDNRKDSNYTILQYEENHSNVDEKLQDLRNIILKYVPSSCETRQVVKVLNAINSLETELLKHTAIEDDVLVPAVNGIEKDEK